MGLLTSCRRMYVSHIPSQCRKPISAYIYPLT
jgi:hypothetical protein